MEKINLLKSIIEASGYYVEESKDCLIISRYSDAGEDFNFTVEIYEDVDKTINKIIEYVDNFNCVEHAEPLIEMRGQRGVPYSISTIIEDAFSIGYNLENLKITTSGLLESIAEEDILIYIEYIKVWNNEKSHKENQEHPYYITTYLRSKDEVKKDKVFVVTLGQGSKEEHENVSGYGKCLGVFKSQQSAINLLEKTKNEIVEEFNSDENNELSIYGSIKEDYYEINCKNSCLDTTCEIFIMIEEMIIDKED